MVFKSRLSADRSYREMRDEWAKSDVFKELTNKLQENQVKIPGHSNMAKKMKAGRRSFYPNTEAYGYESLVRCEYCNKDVDRENELFYTIGKEPSVSDKLAGLDKQRIFSYHAACFQEFAGDEFM